MLPRSSTAWPRPVLPAFALSGALWLLCACDPAPTASAPPPPAETPTAPRSQATKQPAKTQPATGSARSLGTLDGGLAAGALAVTHGGVGSPPSVSDGPDRAAASAHSAMTDKTATSASASDRDEAAPPRALAGAIAGTRVLEDDPRFNAGTGANIRLDGETIQMDASLMTDHGDYAAVAVIERVTSPITAARHVLDSPHVLLAGEGATRFAHKMGMPDKVPTSAPAEEKFRARLKRLGELVGKPGSDAVDWRDYWNFPGELPPEIQAWARGGDTVGTVARDGDGRFAAALSTGGTSVTLYGRVGDVPIYGAGLFAGPSGAVACTGHGEEIIRQGLARRVYERMAAGSSARDAVAAGVREFPAASEVGVIAVDASGWGVAASREMAFGVAPRESPKRGT